MQFGINLIYICCDIYKSFAEFFATNTITKRFSKDFRQFLLKLQTHPSMITITKFTN